MFGPDLGGSFPTSLDEEEDSFGKRLLLAVLPGAIATLIPVAYEIWKEIRDDKKSRDKEEEQTE